MKKLKEIYLNFRLHKIKLLLAGISLLTYSVHAQNTEIWKRHVIDNSLKGADGVRFEDANGDGLHDIVTGWEQSGLVRIYFNPGKEQVKSKWKYVTVGLAPNVEDAVLVDLDGDGSKDVISSCEGNTMRVNVHWLLRRERIIQIPHFGKRKFFQQLLENFNGCLQYRSKLTALMALI